MAKKGDGGGWLILGIAAVGLLYYTQAGRGEENDAAYIPNDLEGRIDLVVEKLNSQFGKWWVDRGLDALRSYLQKTLPPPVVALVNVVYAVELMSRQRPITSYAKQQTAVRRALGG